MGRWIGFMDITKECREDIPDEDLAAWFRESAARQGYHPVSEPVLDWHEITQSDVTTDTVLYGRTSRRVGDWRVRGSFHVAEDAEIVPQ